MKVNKVVLGAAIASTITIAGLASTTYAWHPEGVITKKVQNVTTGSALVEADDVSSAVDAKPGDTLKYVIEVRNKAAAAEKNYNDMTNTVMTDSLPAGVELVNNPGSRQISERLGTIKPGKSVVKEYLVKVTAETEGSIKNTACFTGNTEVNDNPQKGCNPAVVKVTIPPTPEEPETPTPEVPVVTKPTPKPPVAEMPAELPKTGAADIIGGALGLGLLSYAAYRFAQSKRDLSEAFLNVK